MNSERVSRGIGGETFLEEALVSKKKGGKKKFGSHTTKRVKVKEEDIRRREIQLS